MHRIKNQLRVNKNSESEVKASAESKQLSAFSAPPCTQLGKRLDVAPRPRYRNSGAFVHGTKFRNFASIMEQGSMKVHHIRIIIFRS